MATNRDLLKEAIADAKTVKETAIANAKAALEEAFTPYLKEKLSMKINEMDEMDEEEMDKGMYEEEMDEVSYNLKMGIIVWKKQKEILKERLAWSVLAYLQSIDHSNVFALIYVEEDFLETYAFLNQLGVSYLHVFTYSERDNTEAAEMEGIVPSNVRAKRSKMLRGLSVKKRRVFYESQLSTLRTVLFESENKEGYIHGFTENYVKVKTPWNPELFNTLQEVVLTHIDEDGAVRVEF